VHLQQIKKHFIIIQQWYGAKSPEIRFIIATVCLCILFLLLRTFYHNISYVSTDDAFIEGHVIPINPRIASHVQKVTVEDNQEVKAGDLLLELDNRDFSVRFQMVEATVAAAQADAKQAHRDVERYTALSKTDEISKQQLDMALLRADLADAKVAEAKALLDQAALQLSYTTMFSPESGYVTRKSVELGAYVQPGQALMAIVPDEKWVIANFKETQLTHMKPGQKVKIKIDAYPGKKFKGHVDSIQRGTGARFSLFPPENATGNYVKVVQRVPVKIVFDKQPNKKYPLATGMSAVPEVKIR
jgi:membrane fusion protein, multidrug efflux system